MDYDSFETVSQLETASQKALLQNGDSVERVWAAWTLGLNFGSQHLRALEHDPDLDVRGAAAVIKSSGS